jgi:hypothetical protein
MPKCTRHIAFAALFRAGSLALLMSNSSGAAERHAPRRSTPTAQSDKGIAVRVLGSRGFAIDDRLLLAYADNRAEPLRFIDGKEGFTFSDSAYVRVAGDTVIASGALTAMKLQSPRETAKLIVNGKPAKIRRDRGCLVLD